MKAKDEFVLKSSHSTVKPGISGDLHISQVFFSMKLRRVTQLLLALPVFSLVVCLITALVFHSDHINTTICEVYNFIPSISAVTGVSPQRYLWRVCVALHITPRLLVAFVAKEFYKSLTPLVAVDKVATFRGLIMMSFCLNLTELATLCGCTYISNKENYPVHEKFFTLFMCSSLVYMLCVIRIFHCMDPSLLSLHLQRSFSHKKWIFALKVASTSGLLFFFWRHRVFCIPKAYSWFSLCEYLIALCNVMYHISVAFDFSDSHVIVGNVATSAEGTPVLPVSANHVSKHLRDCGELPCSNKNNIFHLADGNSSNMSNDSYSKAFHSRCVDSSDTKSSSVKPILSTILEDSESPSSSSPIELLLEDVEIISRCVNKSSDFREIGDTVTEDSIINASHSLPRDTEKEHNE